MEVLSGDWRVWRRSWHAIDFGEKSWRASGMWGLRHLYYVMLVERALGPQFTKITLLTSSVCINGIGYTRQIWELKTTTRHRK